MKMQNAKVEIICFGAQDVLTTSLMGSTYEYLYVSKDFGMGNRSMMVGEEGPVSYGNLGLTLPQYSGWNTSAIGKTGENQYLKYSYGADFWVSFGNESYTPVAGNQYNGINVDDWGLGEILSWLDTNGNGMRQVQ